MYIIKKIIPLILIVLCLSGCSSKVSNITPVLDAEFNLSALYKAGDFSYSCNIVKTENKVSVTPTSTNASGMTISFDGKSVTFNMEGMEKSFDRSEIDSTNPAVIIYEVFAYLESNAQIKADKDTELFEYTGKTSLGSFTLTLNEDSSFNTLSVPDADISIYFN